MVPSNQSIKNKEKDMRLFLFTEKITTFIFLDLKFG